MKLLFKHLLLLRPDRTGNRTDWSTLTRQRLWTPNQVHLAGYKALCPGWHHQGYLPPAYPQVAAADLHLSLIGDRGFPWIPLGMVHLSQSITQHEPVPVDGTYTLKANLMPGGMHPKGYLVRLSTALHDPRTDHCLWQSDTVALVMRKHATLQDVTPVAPKNQENQDACPSLKHSLKQAWQAALPEDLGRRYARIAGDLNPIHQTAWLAKPFGFKQPIIHGMWSLGWVIHQTLGNSPPSPMNLTACFKRPVFLPGTVYAGHSNAAQGSCICLWTEKTKEPALVVNLKQND